MTTAALPPYPVFDTDADAASLPQKWEEWIDGLEALLSAVDITDHQRKWSTLKFYGGEKLRKLEKQLDYDKTVPYDAEAGTRSSVRGTPGQCASEQGASMHDTPTQGTQDHYRRLKEALTEHFSPRVNETFDRFCFRSMTQVQLFPSLCSV